MHPSAKRVTLSKLQYKPTPLPPQTTYDHHYGDIAREYMRSGSALKAAGNNFISLKARS